MQIRSLTERLNASEVRAKEFENSFDRQSKETMKYIDESKNFEK